MAGDKDSKAAAAAAESKPEPRVRSELTYDRDDLLAYSDDRLGVPAHTLAGALATSDAKEFTISDAKALVRDYLKRPDETER